MNLEKRLKDLLPDYRIHVYDLNKVKDFSAFKTSLRTLFEFYSHRQDGGELEAYIESHKEEVAKLDSESGFLLSVMLEDKRLKEQLLKQKEEARNSKEEENMCKAIDEIIEKGVQRGKREGKIEDIFDYSGL